MHLIFLFWILGANAADRQGNGGDGVVCRDSSHHIIKAELFDYMEAEALRGHVAAFPASVLSMGVIETVHWAIEKLKVFDPWLHQVLTARADQIMNEIRWVQIPLADVPDHGNPLIQYPLGCGVEQAALRREPEFPGEKLFLFNQEIWNHLSPSHQAGLVLHELIYEYLQKQGYRNSKVARFLNGFLVSNEFNAQSQSDYNSIRDKYFIDPKVYMTTMPYWLKSEGAKIEQKVIFRFFENLLTFKEAMAFCEGRGLEFIFIEKTLTEILKSGPGLMESNLASYFLNQEAWMAYYHYKKIGADAPVVATLQPFNILRHRTSIEDSTEKRPFVCIERAI